MNSFFKSTTLFIFFIITVNVTNAQKFKGNQKDINEILKSKSDFSENFINANYEKIANRYTLNAKLFPVKSNIVMGRESIKKLWILPEN